MSLQETRVLLAAAKQHRQSNFQPVPVKTEPGKSATRAEGLLPAAEKPNTPMISVPCCLYIYIYETFIP